MVINDIPLQGSQIIIGPLIRALLKYLHLINAAVQALEKGEFMAPGGESEVGMGIGNYFMEIIIV